jgi:hypothetical protein
MLIPMNTLKGTDIVIYSIYLASKTELFSSSPPRVLITLVLYLGGRLISMVIKPRCFSSNLLSLIRVFSYYLGLDSIEIKVTVGEAISLAQPTIYND